MMKVQKKLAVNVLRRGYEIDGVLAEAVDSERMPKTDEIISRVQATWGKK